MRNKLALFIAALCTLFTLEISAQEVVRLKNGSAIKGKVIEQDFEKGTIKIETADGSIFVYNTSELDKIEKVAAAPNQQNYSSSSSYQSSSSSANTEYDWLNPYFRRGYRGFAGFSGGFGDDVIHVSSYTIHGAQILPFFICRCWC